MLDDWGFQMIGTEELGKLLGISPRRVRALLKAGRVEGAFKVGGTWVIPLVDGEPVIQTSKYGPKATWEKKLKSPSPTYIHVNTKLFGKKDKDGEYVPVITVKKSSQNIYSRRVVIPGPCTVVYDFENAKYGAKTWIETFVEPMTVGDRLTYAEIQAMMAA